MLTRYRWPPGIVKENASEKVVKTGLAEQSLDLPGKRVSEGVGKTSWFVKEKVGKKPSKNLFGTGETGIEVPKKGGGATMRP